MTIYLGTTPLTSTSGQRNIGQIIQSTIPLTDAGLHLLDGSVISGNGAYSAFVTYIAGLVSGHSELFTTEANWQTSNDNYGACDKFVYDSVNNTVRLPKRVTDHGVLIKSYSSGTDWYRIYSDGWCEQGGFQYIAGSSGEITYNINLHKAYVDNNYSIFLTSGVGTSGWQYANGACVGIGGNTVKDGIAYTTYFRISNPTGSGNVAIYWRTAGYTDISDLQQTPVYEYIVIANSVKTPIEVDIDEVMTDLNGKVDIADLATCHVVVETYVNGSSWYRVYSDGWCEQGGQISGGTDGMTTISFMKKFVNDLPKILLQRYSTTHADPGSGGLDRRFSVVTYRDSTSFYVWNATWGGLEILEWQACGYIR